MLIDYAFSAAIPIAHGDPDGGDKDGRDGVRSAVKSGSYCAEMKANRPQSAVHAAKAAAMID